MKRRLLLCSLLCSVLCYGCQSPTQSVIDTAISESIISEESVELYSSGIPEENEEVHNSAYKLSREEIMDIFMEEYGPVPRLEEDTEDALE